MDQKNLFLGETFANLRFVWFGSHRRAFFGGYLQFDAHQQSFLGRPLLHISLMISAASESPFKLLCANGSVAALIVSVITDEARDGPDAAIRAAHRSLRDLSRFSPQFDWNFSREALDPIFS